MDFRSARWIALMVGLLLAGFALAQGQSAATPVISVTSKPSGVTVVLSGDFTVAGTTPTTFSQKLAGLYRITAHHEGYETYHSSVVFTGRDAVSLDIKMSPKTRMKAAVRSVLIPGWGQIYSGSKLKGSLLTIGTVAAGATVGVLHLRFDNRRDDYNDFKDKFNSTRSVSERETMLAQLYSLQKRAYDAERDRNIAGAVLAGIWAYNLLDAILFFPDYGLNVSGTTLGVYPGDDGKGVQVVGRVRF